ncbi:hypothetical protein AWV80_00210 [Cupriavidus sp. UYMU48A]|nr:hypothetical protein AWV80_00210 [Cupriavidus sp. UYMU48A]
MDNGIENQLSLFHDSGPDSVFKNEGLMFFWFFLSVAWRSMSSLISLRSRSSSAIDAAYLLRRPSAFTRIACLAERADSRSECGAVR